MIAPRSHGKRRLIRCGILLAILVSVNAAAIADQNPPPPSLANCRFDASVNTAAFAAIRAKYLSQCFDHEIRVMRMSEQQYKTNLANYQATVPGSLESARITNGLVADQFWENKIILGIVLVIVGSGLVLAFMQFEDSRSHRRARLQAQKSVRGISEAADTANSTSSVELSNDRTAIAMQSVVKFGSLEVQSAVLGVTILALSLVFFFLYLEFIYKITPISTPQ